MVFMSVWLKVYLFGGVQKTAGTEGRTRCYVHGSYAGTPVGPMGPTYPKSQEWRPESVLDDHLPTMILRRSLKKAKPIGKV